ncbi:tRNA synthetases class II core domain (F)-domain-containing protein [Pelagophyceae sp. CCMP2097]|nr:tRNA synthetases class II core domain (F)-domain-containing protein [Pelagophyceae sp. CCMP2097]
MADLEAHVLAKLKDVSSAIDDSSAEAAALGVEHQVLIGVLKSLWADDFVTMEQASRSSLELTAEAQGIVAKGSPEFLVYAVVAAAGAEGCAVSAVELALGKDEAKVGLGAAMREKWVKKQGDVLICAAAVAKDETRSALVAIQASGSSDAATEKALARRKLVVKNTLKFYAVGRGAQYAAERVRKVGDLTVEALRDGSWETAQFKDYNFNAVGEKCGGGYIQPLLKVRAEFRKILIGMGFEEMPTSRWVESSFWNFDALFQPQSHPARDAHDTFFVKEPAETLRWPEEYYERVKEMHVSGGAGSIGHRCPFEEKEARKNLLRTHTTSVSSQMLYKLANRPGGFTPVKYFSVDRVFRNETMDSTHLCEFHQLEGLVADYDLSLGDLIGTIRTFFAKIGITQLRFKPAFNPYTEPSMEVFGYHPDLKKWTELGNSGMFRPEMLRPMGLPENVRVIAWGLSLERPTMIKYRISNIRDLFGHKADIANTRNAPICVFP